MSDYHPLDTAPQGEPVIVLYETGLPQTAILTDEGWRQAHFSEVFYDWVETHEPLDREPIGWITIQQPDLTPNPGSYKTRPN